MQLGAPPAPLTTGSFPATPVTPTPTPQAPAPQPWWQQFLLQVPQIIGTARTSEALLKINRQRLAAGLPPVDAGALAPQVNVGVAPSVVSQITWPLLLLGGAVLFLAMQKRR
jgi:hypothetical protein